MAEAGCAGRGGGGGGTGQGQLGMEGEAVDRMVHHVPDNLVL